jgi:hypothetical protein
MTRLHVPGVLGWDGTVGWSRVAAPLMATVVPWIPFSWCCLFFSFLLSNSSLGLNSKNLYHFQIAQCLNPLWNLRVISGWRGWTASPLHSFCSCWTL